MNEIGVTIDGKQFNNMLFHFMLPYSRWEYATICYSESFESLSKSYEDAVWSLGFVAYEHRTDNLTAATQAFGSKRAFTRRRQEVMDHYGVVASRNNPGVSHENVFAPNTICTTIITLGSLKTLEHHVLKHLDSRLL